MNTEEQRLLNYMYMDGCTDEDMYDPDVLRVYRNSFAFRIHCFRIDLSVFVKTVKEAFEKAARNMKDVFSSISALCVEETHEIQQPHSRSYQPIDLKKRQRLQHQVLDRKPHLVRKIFR